MAGSAFLPWTEFDIGQYGMLVLMLVLVMVGVVVLLLARHIRGDGVRVQSGGVLYDTGRAAPGDG